MSIPEEVSEEALADIRSSDPSTSRDALQALYTRSFEDAVKTTITSLGAVEAVIDAMLVHRFAPSIHRLACGVLWNLSPRKSTQRLICVAGGVEAILSAMRLHRDDTLLIQRAGGTLWNVSNHDANKREMALYGTAEVFISAMRKCIGDPVIQQKGCAVLWNLCYIEENVVQVVEAGGSEAILECMKAHPDDGVVQQNACGALWNIAKYSKNMYRITRAGGMQLMIAAMKRFPHARLVQQKASGAMFYFGKDADNRITIAEEGGLECFVHALRNHLKDLSTLRSACGAIWDLALNNDNKARLLELHVNDAIVKMMEHQPTDPMVQQKGCGAFMVLSFCKDNRTDMCNVGAIEAIVTAMKNHPVDSIVQGEACGALWNITDVPKNRAEVVRVGGIPALLSAVKNHKQHEEVPTKACSTLWNLCYEDTFSKQIAELGVMEAVVSAMSFSDRPLLMEKTAGLLFNLAKCAPNRKLFVKSGALEALVDVVKRRRGDARAQQNAAGALWDLALEEENVKEMNRLGIVEVLCHFSEKSMQEDVPYRVGEISQSKFTGAMNQISYNPEMQGVMVDFGAAKWIAKAMMSYSESCDVLASGSSCLWNLATLPEHKKRVGSEGAIEAVVLAMRKFVTHAGVQRKAVGALFVLMKENDNMEAVVKSGAVDLCIDACDRFCKTDKYVFQNACGALWDFSSKKELREKIGQRHIKSIHSALTTTELNSDGFTMEKATGCLHALSVTEKIARQIASGEKSVLSSLCSIMRKHPHNRIIQEEGCGTLRSVSDYKDLGRALVDAGAIATLVEAVKGASQNQVVPHDAAAVFASLASCEELCVELANDGAVVCAVGMLKHPRHKRDKFCVTMCCEMLAYCSFDSVARVVACKAGAGPAMEAALSSFPNMGNRIAQLPLPIAEIAASLRAEGRQYGGFGAITSAVKNAFSGWFGRGGGDNNVGRMAEDPEPSGDRGSASGSSASGSQELECQTKKDKTKKR